MTRLAEIRELLIATLREVQEMSGREWVELSPKDKPIGALEGFDSLCALETTVLLQEKLATALKLPKPVKLSADGVFVAPSGSRARSVEEVVQALLEAVGGPT